MSDHVFVDGRCTRCGINVLDIEVADDQPCPSDDAQDERIWLMEQEEEA